MNRKILHFFVALVLLMAGMSISVKDAHASHSCPYWYGCYSTCTGKQSCYYMDPAYTTYNSQYCSADVITVTGSKAVSGAYGQVYDELRWSAHCIANWTRGTVYAASGSGGNAYQMGIRALPLQYNTGSYFGYYITSVVYGSQMYTLMVDGEGKVEADAGLYNKLCTGNTDSKGNSTGWGGSPNCTNLYNPSASYSG